jgi:pyruvate dehydrogenase E1 component alpha subunit
VAQFEHQLRLSKKKQFGEDGTDALRARSFFHQILRIRRFEEELIKYCASGDIKMPVHLSIGQEGVAVGVASALRPCDKIVSNHRCHGHYLAKGGDMKKAMAELFGKTTGCCCGKGGSMHLFDEKAGVVCSVPVVGASIAIGVGISLSTSIKGGEKVTVAFFGDGAVEEGIFWESLNFASVFKLPIVFVCENNFYATHSPLLKRQPSEQIAPRVAPHGIEVYRIDGNDVAAVHEIAAEAIQYARAGRPAFIEALTYRYKEHWGGNDDWDLGYRSREEVEHWKEKDPLLRVKSQLMQISMNDIELLEGHVKAEIEEAINFAINSPEPSREHLLL